MSIALVLLPDFLLILVGVLLSRLRAFDAAFWAGAERLVYFVLFPALLFRSLATGAGAIGDSLPFVATGLAFTLAGIALSFLARFLFRLPEGDFAACFQCGFRFNTYLALSVAERLQAARGLAAVTLLVGVLVPVVNLAAVGMLARGGEARVLPALARNPLVLACVAGLACAALGWPLPAVADRVLSSLGGAALALGLLTVGAALKLRLDGTLPLPAVAYWTAVKLVVLPACALLVGRLLGLGESLLQLAVVMAAVPTAPSAYVLATQMGGHGRPVALLVTLGTLLAAVTLPLWLAATG
ncbi:MAG TPA: AEC family transporter [Casimicrobiaceae bacterium]|nr:AEC family transporter [Casimicrobiaceae bacterium]